MKAFKKELTELINKHSLENNSGTPDYIIADYLMLALENLNRTIATRKCWYGAEGRVTKIEITEELKQTQ
tara:strand:- start:4337 stop:4546 length:210 start_codon:yes stop_codon:yes gene_type:complete